MKKTLFFAAAALAMLASCSQNDDLNSAPVVSEVEDNAITFGTYVGKNVNTRATAYVGDIKESGTETAGSKQLKNANVGFGVFAYNHFQNTTPGSETDYPNSTTTNSEPGSVSAHTWKANFMFNQKVTWSSSVWSYSPLKYWPNEFANGNVDGQSPAAQGSTARGKLSFFAYAPYMDEVGSTGITAVNGQTNLTTAAAQTGNPKITYKMATSGKNVDLLWGTCPEDVTGTYNVAPSGTQTGGWVWGKEGTTTKNYGMTNVNLTKQTTNSTETSAEKVNFLFKHALAKIGGGSKESNSNTDGLLIKLAPDFGESFGDQTDAETVVTVNYINIKSNTANNGGTPKVYTYPKETEGTLDLATGIWSHPDTKTQDLFEQNIKINPNPSNANEIKINPDIEEITTFTDAANAQFWGTSTGNMLAGTHKGVTKTTQPVYATDQAPLLYFPGETPSLEVEIEYVVRTKDNNLELGYSQVTQKIKRIVTFTKAVEMNKRYNLTIILGLTSVKFEATVSDWSNTYDDDNNSSTPEVPTDEKVDLPLNVTA